jgi:hypothetical protein
MIISLLKNSGNINVSFQNKEGYTYKKVNVKTNKNLHYGKKQFADYSAFLVEDNLGDLCYYSHNANKTNIHIIYNINTNFFIAKINKVYYYIGELLWQKNKNGKHSLRLNGVTPVNLLKDTSKNYQIFLNIFSDLNIQITHKSNHATYNTLCNGKNKHWGDIKENICRSLKETNVYPEGTIFWDLYKPGDPITRTYACFVQDDSAKPIKIVTRYIDESVTDDNGLNPEIVKIYESELYESRSVKENAPMYYAKFVMPEEIFKSSFVSHGEFLNTDEVLLQKERDIQLATEYVNVNRAPINTGIIRKRLVEETSKEIIDILQGLVDRGVYDTLEEAKKAYGV